MWQNSNFSHHKPRMTVVILSEGFTGMSEAWDPRSNSFQSLEFHTSLNGNVVASGRLWVASWNCGNRVLAHRRTIGLAWRGPHLSPPLTFLRLPSGHSSHCKCCLILAIWCSHSPAGQASAGRLSILCANAALPSSYIMHFR